MNFGLIVVVVFFLVGPSSSFHESNGLRSHKNDTTLLAPKQLQLSTNHVKYPINTNQPVIISLLVITNTYMTNDLQTSTDLTHWTTIISNVGSNPWYTNNGIEAKRYFRTVRH